MNGLADASNDSAELGLGERNTNRIQACLVQ